MGLGQLGGSELIFKRKFRWTFRVENVCGNKKIPESFVKLAARPTMETEELEINFLNAKTWIPGKTSWSEITVTYYDVATKENTPLWDWLASIYNFTDDVTLQQASRRDRYSATGILTLFDGCGNELERWTLKDLWPKSVNFGDLDYAANDEMTIELSMRYSRVKYEPICPSRAISPCCGSCSGDTGSTN